MSKVRSFSSIFISVLLVAALLFPRTVFAAAAEWPDNTDIAAEGGILMDADSGVVLYGKNIHTRYFPASITKILTALLVIENCNLDDTITFSHDAVYDVEAGSTNAGYDVGDKITVRQALYAMLLKSANEVANALAEHCAGSIDKFADLMNQRAKQLGCTDTHFANPSGLNDDNHYTTPYDFALICKAAYANPTFVEFDSTTYYELPANARNSKSFIVYCGHKMLKKNSSSYYPGVIGGKTGYTTLAGNTLVTCAARDGLKLICVILNGHQTHYTDTKTLLDFGFSSFQSISIGDCDTAYSSVQDNIDLTGNADTVFRVDGTKKITIPKNASFADTTSKISYEPGENDPPGSIARIDYSYGDHFAGSTWLMTDDTAVGIQKKAALSTATPSDKGSVQDTDGTADKSGGLQAVIPKVLPAWVKILLIVLLAAAALFGLYHLLKYIIAKKEEKEVSLARENRRRKRIESGMTDDFLKDSSASVNSYLKDSRPRNKGFGPHNRT